MTVETLIEKLEQERCEAQIAGDVNKLDLLLSTRLNWCHSSGKIDNKASLLENVKSGKIKYVSMKRSNKTYIVGQEAVVATGLVEMVAILAGEERHLSNLYTTAWFKEDDGWKLVAWQSTRAPE